MVSSAADAAVSVNIIDLGWPRRLLSGNLRLLYRAESVAN
jgi:hypothetical protein